ncbi:YwdI family protein [Domibacillus aminovorans]|uniref:Uncharacterized protein n=1 Tax=Domibacillus aminovorans TaxID=29332 RepID=A0A177KZR6_9BACI|nr:YwdI family protein [Domibacillus aminovorans]OAH58853.1 hypothetical protein AWH49_04075 [Domibacillus aminovorans]
MNISHEKVLAKMEQEMAAAKMASPDDVKRHVYAIKSMCELMLGAEVSAYEPRPIVTPPAVMHTQSPATIQQTERLTTEDGSNGESIFDF